ncbi:MAG: phosphonopyruvate decarboxylase [Thermoprotei archaeon]|nr:MAG: phosphonopyruvate decarboxylase [Thermoprotei archaeon]
MVKLIYLVIDGAADKIQDSPTSLELARTPGLDQLAKISIGGLVYTIGPGIAPESDCAVLSILGYNPHIHYTGRGPLEALGVGIRIREEYEVAFRANFATIDPNTLRIIDRRVKRSLTSNEASILAKALDNLDLGKYDAYVRVIATIGHRAVVIIGSKTHKLSDMVENTDPAYRRRGRISIAVKHYKPYIVMPKPLDNSNEAKVTAELVSIFTRRSIEILDNHPVNIERSNKGFLKANAILLRDAGNKLPKIKPINDLFGRKFGGLAEMPVEIGIARLLGMKVIERPPLPSKEEDYRIRLEEALKLLKEVDVVYVHLKGPDEPAHDGDQEGKIKAIEMIDKYFVQPLINNIDLSEVGVLVTSDHATPPKTKAHTDDPVPFILAWHKLKPDGIRRFTEIECREKGSLGAIKHGYELLPKILNIINSM